MMIHSTRKGVNPRFAYIKNNYGLNRETAEFTYVIISLQRFFKLTSHKSDVWTLVRW